MANGVSLSPVTAVVDAIALLSIRSYQRYLSPHKGFRCAYRCLYETESCSEYVRQAIAQQGLLAALPLMRQRFQDCQDAELLIRAGSAKDDERSYREWKKGEFRQRTRREMYRQEHSCCSRGCQNVPIISRCGLF